MATKKESENKTDDPCWKGYEQVGMKTKGGKKSAELRTRK